MKIIKLLPILAALAINAIAQDQQTTKETSNAAILASKSGSLLEIQYIEIGNIDEVDVRVMKITDHTSGTSLSALRFEYQFAEQVLTQTKIAIVDADEVVPLFKAIKQLQTKVTTSEKLAFTEIKFKSRAGFVVGCSYNPEKSVWTAYLQLNSNDSKSTVTIPLDELSVLQSLVEQAQAKL
jgi:hypothetical protein